MRRRSFVIGFGSAVVAPTLSRRLAAAQQSAKPLIGVLSSRSSKDSTLQDTAFRRALSELGYVEGQNVAFDYRWADGQYDRLPGLAADLISRRVVVIFASGPASYAAKAATTTIPIVFVAGDDPVNFGLARFDRPEGNITGVNTFNGALGSKRLELLCLLVPHAAVIALLVNPNFPQSAGSEASGTDAAARALGRELIPLTASTEGEIDAAFATLVQRRVDALLVHGDPFFVSRRDKVVALAARHAVPTIYVQREFVAAGGLIGYGTSLTDAYRQAGIYVGRILKGVKVADLPVVQPTKFELVLNLKTAKALGLEIPPTLLAIADEVIQ
jgi:putative tryptophan/tyrosine transport system substrate-binding protein